MLNSTLFLVILCLSGLSQAGVLSGSGSSDPHTSSPLHRRHHGNQHEHLHLHGHGRGHGRGHGGRGGYHKYISHPPIVGGLHGGIRVGGGNLPCSGPGCPVGGSCLPGACNGCIKTPFGFECGTSTSSSFFSKIPGGSVSSFSSGSSSFSSFSF